MGNKQLYRLEVAPLVIIPLSRSPYFTYASSISVRKGSLVSISFGKQTVEGVVFDCQALPGNKPSWMKLISHVVRESFLTEKQCALAETVSREYFTPLGKTLKHFLPKASNERLKKETGSSKKKKPFPRATEDEQKMLEILIQAKIPTYIDTSLLDDPKKLWNLVAQQCLRGKQQILIIVPEITLVFSLEAYLGSFFEKKKLAILHSKLSSGAFFSAWERIRGGEASVIIATRQGLFAPFYNLGAIIVTEEQDESYKQWDMSPRYHGKRVASMLASLHQAKLILSSGTPSTESLFLIKEKKLLPLRPIVKHLPLGNALTIINLKLERYRKNFSPLSEALVQAIRETLTEGNQALLYINRQGMNAFSVCDACKNTIRCKNCQHPLGTTREGYFRCSACGYKTSLFPNCPNCGHLAFRHIGFGTEKVEREVLRLFPEKKISRLDSTTLRTVKTAEILSLKGLAGEIDVLVGTQMALKDPPLPKLSLIAMIDADSLLLFPDFRADERLFQDLSRAARQVKKRGRFGQVLLQTFHPESAFFQRISTMGSAELLASILAERKELFYPPFARLITFTCQGKTEKEVIKKATERYAALKEVIPNTCRLRPPGAIRLLKKQSLFECDLLIRLPASDLLLSEEIVSILIKNGKDCIIDVDPITLK